MTDARPTPTTFFFYCKNPIIPCRLTLINSTPDDERDAIAVLSHRIYTRAQKHLRRARIFLLEFSRRINSLASLDKSFVEGAVESRDPSASMLVVLQDDCGIFEHTVYMARRFLARTVRRLPSPSPSPSPSCHRSIRDFIQ